jgi:hypothetical protein
MTDEEVITEIAGRVIEALSASVIPSSIPADIGNQIRETTKSGSYYWTHTIPLMAGRCIIAAFQLNPDGTLHLEFRDWTNCPFWRGTFRPAVAE